MTKKKRKDEPLRHVSIYSQSNEYRPGVSVDRCRSSVDRGRMGVSQCQHKPSVQRKLKPPQVHKAGTFGFCSSHDPERVAERLAAKLSKYDLINARRDANYKVEEIESKIGDALIKLPGRLLPLTLVALRDKLIKLRKKQADLQ